MAESPGDERWQRPRGALAGALARRPLVSQAASPLVSISSSILPKGSIVFFKTQQLEEQAEVVRRTTWLQLAVSERKLETRGLPQPQRFELPSPSPGDAPCAGRSRIFPLQLPHCTKGDPGWCWGSRGDTAVQVYV